MNGDDWTVSQIQGLFPWTKATEKSVRKQEKIKLGLIEPREPIKSLGFLFL